MEFLDRKVDISYYLHLFRGYWFYYNQKGDFSNTNDLLVVEMDKLEEFFTAYPTARLVWGIMLGSDYEFVSGIIELYLTPEELSAPTIDDEQMELIVQSMNSNILKKETLKSDNRVAEAVFSFNRFKRASGETYNSIVIGKKRDGMKFFTPAPKLTNLEESIAELSINTPTQPTKRKEARHRKGRRLPRSSENVEAQQRSKKNDESDDESMDLNAIPKVEKIKKSRQLPNVATLLSPKS